MALTVREVCIDALTMLGVVSEGANTAVAYDIDRAKKRFVRLLLQLTGSGAFGDLTDVLVSEDYTANENERITTDTPINIEYPGSIEDTDEFTGATITRPPYDKSVVINVGVATDIYDADVGQWLTIDTLDLDDTAPLSGRYGTGLAALLAVELAAERGATVGPSLAAMADAGARALYMKRRVVAVPEASLIFRRTWLA